MLFIEYDVDAEGTIEIVALVNAVEEDGQDPDGEAWMAWRRSFEDAGLGCAPVPQHQLEAMEETTDPEQLREVVERVVLADRATKETSP